MKSTYSSRDCVDVSKDDEGNVIVQHSATKELSHGTYITFTPDEWSAFLAGVKDGEFEHERLTIRS
jgi:hypothetical protein